MTSTPHLTGSPRDWYSDSRLAIRRVYGKDWRLFCSLLACTSPNSSIKSNLTLATKAYNQLQSLGSIQKTGFIRTHYKSMTSALSRKDLRPNGRKCQALFSNLTGKDESKVTVDIWMMRYARIPKKAPSARDYDIIEAHVQDEADELGIKPCQRQAEIWCEIRGNKASYATYLTQLKLF